MYRTHYKTDTDTATLVTACVFILACLGFIITMLTGWVLNIFALIAMIDGGVTAMFIVRILGVVVAPLGSILGLFF